MCSSITEFALLAIRLHGSIHSHLQTSATLRLNHASTHGVVSGYMCCVFCITTGKPDTELGSVFRDNRNVADDAAGDGDGDGDDICGSDDVITITITSNPTLLITQPRERNVREVKFQMLLTTSD